MNRTTTTLLALVAALHLTALQSNAAIVVTGDPTAGTGVITLTQDVTLTITTTTSNGRLVVFDEWVIDDTTGNNVNLNPVSFTFDLNGGGDQSSSAGLQLRDNSSGPTGNVTANDGFFFLPGTGFSVSLGDAFTLKAGSWTMNANANFNPNTVGTFTGNIFLADGSGNRISNNALVPEPSAASLLLLAATGIIMRRRRV